MYIKLKFSNHQLRILWIRTKTEVFFSLNFIGCNKAKLQLLVKVMTSKKIDFLSLFIFVFDELAKQES